MQKNPLPWNTLSEDKFQREIHVQSQWEYVINLLFLVDKKAKKPQEDKKILNIRPFFKDIEKGLIDKMITIKFGKGSMSESM